MTGSDAEMLYAEPALRESALPDTLENGFSPRSVLTA